MADADPPQRTSTSADIDLNNIGTANYVVAAYSNGLSNAVVVLRRSEGALAKVAEPAIPYLNGSWSRLEARDVDGDRKPEIILSIASGRGNIGMWILKWDGLTLTSVGPMGDVGGARPAGLLRNTDLIDIDGDGLLEAVNSPGYLGDGTQPDDPPREMRSEIFRLLNGRYSASPAYALVYDSFRRTTGGPAGQERQFIVNQPGPGLRLRILNGGFGTEGERRVSSGTVSVNGTVVVSPGQFSQNVRIIDVPVTVGGANTLSVTLAGAPGGSIVVLVLPRSN